MTVEFRSEAWLKNRLAIGNLLLVEYFEDEPVEIHLIKNTHQSTVISSSKRKGMLC